MLFCLTCAALTLPFYLHDPANFGPLEAADRLTRFDGLAPHLAVLLMGVMALLSLGLSFQDMGADGSALFRNCALVQAFPVLAGLLLSSMQERTPELGYTAYGTFFACFALFGLLREKDGLLATLPQGGPQG